MVPFLPNPSGDKNHPQGSLLRLLEDQMKREDVTKLILLSSFLRLPQAMAEME